MTVDADVIVSDARTYPVATIKPYYVPIEHTNKIIESLFGSLDVYNGHIERTREQIEEMIVQVKADLQTYDKEDDPEYYASLENTLESLYESRETAPEAAQATKYSGEYSVTQNGACEQWAICIREDPYDIYSPTLQIHHFINSPYGNGFDMSVDYGCFMLDDIPYIDENTGKLKFGENPVFNTDDAKEAVQTANEFLNEIGIEGRYVSNITARCPDESVKDIETYVISFGHIFNGINMPVSANSGGVVPVSQEDFIQRFEGEILQVEVRDGNVSGARWSSAYTVGTVLNENIELMSFEEIMANAENQLAVKFAYLGSEDSQSMVYSGGEMDYELYVDEIILTYAIQPIKDKKYEYMLVPVWGFYGGYDYGDGCEMVDGSIREGRYIMRGSLLTINAVDGTVIGQS
jgi:hypothetical protein